MTSRVTAFMNKERFAFISFAIFLIVVSVAVIYSYPIPLKLQSIYFGRQSRAVTAGISADKKYVYGKTGEMAASPDLAHFIEAGDLQGVASTIQADEVRNGLTAITAADANGVTLARTKFAANLGDFIFQTTEYGEKVAEGSSTVGVEDGTRLPLIVIAGFPVEDNGKMVGGIFGGYSVDDTYAHAFRGRYLSPDVNLIFYSKAVGVIGTTFEDPKTKTLLDEYFSVGSDWIAKQTGNQNVIIEGRSYFLQNIGLPGISGDKSDGGVLVLYPSQDALAAVAFALLATLLFILVVIFFHIRIVERRRWKYEYLMLGVFSAVIFIIALLEAYLLLYKNAIDVQPPPYPIYNSTLSIEPIAGIFDLSSEQQVAITLSTGGETVNAAEVDLSYNPAMMRVADISTAASFCSPSMFLAKEIDNVAGKVHIECATPDPVSGNAVVADLDIQAIKEGAAALHFETGTRVLANDGLGTDVLRLATDAEYHFADERQIATANGIPSVLAFSPTHPNGARWYNDNTVSMVWKAVPGARYRYAIDASPDAESLADASDTSGNGVTLMKVPDGKWYFHVAAEKNGILGPVTNYRLMIDTQPPTNPAIQASQSVVQEGDIVRLVFSSTSTLAGLSKNYYVKFDGGVFLPTASPLYISLPSGTHVIVVRAFDQAGNFADSNTVIDVTDGGR